jgi:hypothetical protein
MPTVRDLKKFLKDIPDSWEVSLTCEDALIVYNDDTEGRDKNPDNNEKIFVLLP